MPVLIEKLIYGGAGLAHEATGATLQIPFTLAGERVDFPPLQIREPSINRVAPPCPHFGACGGCHYQHSAYAEQLRIKTAILVETMNRAGVTALPEIVTISAEPWRYRNRIRLRLQRVDGEPRVGYSLRGTNHFLPITECPIAAPLLWSAAQALIAAATENRDAAAWFDFADEVEFFVNDSESRVLATLLCASSKLFRKESFQTFARSYASLLPQLTGLSVIRTDPRSGRTLEVFGEWGAQGLPYSASGEQYWISRGGFFQVNRFLIEALVSAVCDGRSGNLVWDLFAGVGLFSRVLARSFAQVTGVEANPAAATDLREALRKAGPRHTAVKQTTLDFLRGAVLQRERPDLVVLDPPRAGAGIEACTLLAQLRAPQLVYVSCDPTTLGRDLRQLQSSGYRIATLSLIDLFPQTYHIETIATLSLG